ncbi:SLC26A/SulP transporter family protein [Candidatus Magnetaquicoccus inordinatus]|uniref:SLC26A/SulP transporter family protein n=1 Tax=Candidatus Magnetaquicoccus inordinatus TaxID=2496818 RepID=UPI00102D286C|nr:SLC26A/SulP transporter family protein [Candidatus Magnetaquicoccus inordinatus]
MSALSKDNLIGDFWGGLTAVLVALPSAIAYGLAGYVALGPEYVGFAAMTGVIGTVALGLVSPALGGAPRLITAPCAPAAAVLAAIITDMLAGKGFSGPLTPDRILLLLTVVALLSGFLQFLYGALGGGKLIKYIPFPVVSGYLSGVGTIIFVSQIPKLLGLPKGTNPWVGVVTPSLWQYTGIAVGITTIIVMLMAPRITKKLPAPILGLLGGMTVYFSIGLLKPELYELAGNSLLIGPINLDMQTLANSMHSRWDSISQIQFADLAVLIVPALTLSILLSIDTLKTCVVMDALTRSRHRSNQELIAQGVGNFVAALTGGMPGAGTMGATLVNLNSGAKTRFSGVFEGIGALAVLLFLSPLISWVPISALAGILIVVAFRMFDWHSFQLLRQKSTLLDFFVIASVIFVALRFNLIAASGTGIGLAMLLFLREQVRSSVVRRLVQGDHLSSKRNRLPEEKEILATHGVHTTVCEIQGNLFFGTTDQLFTQLEPAIRSCRYLILDMRRVQSVDFTAVHMLEQIEAMLKDRGAHLIFCDLPVHLSTGQDLRTYFAQMGLLRPDELQLFPSLDEALEWVEEKILQENHLLDLNEEVALTLDRVPLLRGFDNQDGTLDLLQSIVEERHCQPGEAVFRQGDEGDELYIIRRGSVRILLPLGEEKFRVLAIFGRGHFIGDMAFLDRGKRSTDAVAEQPTDIYILSRKRFDELTQSHPQLGLKVFLRLAKVLSSRLRFTNAELSAMQNA